MKTDFLGKDNAVIALVGTPGAGKTTIGRQTLDAKIFPGEWAWAVNDDSKEGNVDAVASSAGIHLLPLENGCFTCTNESERRALFTQVQRDGINLIFEGMGMVAGTETTSSLNAAMPPETRLIIVALLDVLLFEKNRKEEHWGEDLIISQLQAATGGIYLTKYDPSITSVDDPRLSRFLEFILRHAPGKPIYLIPESWTLPLDVLRSEKEAERDHGHDQHVHTASCGHGHAHHEHDERCGHAHHGAAPPSSYLLHPSVTLEQVQRILNDTLRTKLGINTVKGSCKGHQFRCDVGTWGASVEDVRSWVTLYWKREKRTEEIPDFADIAQINPDHIVRGKTSEILRADVRPENRDRVVAAILAALDEIPTEPVINSFGQLITHPPELQHLKEVARKPSIKPVVFGSVIKRCTEYWVAAGRLLWEREAFWNPAVLANNKRELGISLTWWATYNEADLGAELYGEVVAVNPSKMVLDGFAVLSSAHSDEEKGWWLAEEVGVAARFAIKHRESKDTFIHVLRRCLDVYREHSAPERVTAHWAEVLAEIEQY